MSDMDIAAEVRQTLADEWLPKIYEQKVRSQRTRAYQLDIPERANDAEILHTLLGIELKVGKRRFACPDLATARYMRIFARAGCREFAVPYEITKISAIADDMETAWQKMMLYFDMRTADLAPSSGPRAKLRLLNGLRRELKAIGAGTAMPEFRQSTKQRNS